jgi:cytochrome c553
MASRLRWRITAAVVGVVVSAFVANVALDIASRRRLGVTRIIAVDALELPTDAEAIAWGRHLAKSVLACGHCHGEDLGGGVVIDGPPGQVYAPNITSGQGSVTSSFVVADWVRVIRHGVKNDGTGALIMPSDDYVNLSGRDLAALIAYLRQAPPVHRPTQAVKLSPLGALLVMTGGLPIHADGIDHAAPLPASPDPGSEVAYGAYLVSLSCEGCHGPNLTGGPMAGLPPGVPDPADISRQALADWTASDFAAAVTTGVGADGVMLNAFMPYRSFASMTPPEVSAIWAYIQSASG